MVYIFNEKSEWYIDKMVLFFYISFYKLVPETLWILEALLKVTQHAA